MVKDSPTNLQPIRKSKDNGNEKGSKHGKSRFLSLMSGACKWIGEVEWKGNIRFDSVIVHDTKGLIDHIENAGRKGLR